HPAELVDRVPVPLTGAAAESAMDLIESRRRCTNLTAEPQPAAAGQEGRVELAHDLMGFVDASPTPFHAVHNAAARLIDAGFEQFDPQRATQPGARFVVRDGALVAWFDGERTSGPLRMIGAHTDSPNLRIRPRP